MFSFLIELLKDLFLYVGYIKNNTFENPLSEEMEKYYLECWKNKDLNARSKLIEHNLRLVAHIAKKYENCNEQMEDLISIGTIGLIKAVDSYNFTLNNRLGAYAAKCIENEILMHLRSLKKCGNDLYLFDAIGEDADGSELALIDIIPAESIDYSEKLDVDNKIKLLRNFYTILDKTEMEILSYRYGLNGYPEKTQKEIGKIYNISRSYVSRIEKRALTKLLFEFRKQGLA